jgi:chromosome partitioning protein
MKDIRAEAQRNQWKIFKHEIPFPRGFSKLMRGNYRYLGNAGQFHTFAEEFFNEIGL